MNYSALPEKYIANFIESRQTITNKVLIALSGGPDSVALFIAANIVMGPDRVYACWVNHGIRPKEELEQEEAFVKTLCESYSSKLIVEVIKPGFLVSVAAKLGGIESAARAYRYKALEKVRKKTGCDLIFTGHNADDNIETIIMRFCQGSGLSGLRGIFEQRDNLGRPFLELWRKEILEYLKQKKQAYSVDSTNLRDDYLRNSLRHNVIPVILDTFPSLPKALSFSSKKAALDEEALDFFAEKLLTQNHSGQKTIRASAFDASPIAVRLRALYKLLLELKQTRFPWRLVYSAAVSKKRAGQLASGAGIVFYRKSGHIYIVPEKKMPKQDSLANHGTGFAITVNKPGNYRIGRQLACKLYLKQESPGLRLDAFSWPLCLRSRLNGDYMQCSFGTKSLDALSAEKNSSDAMNDLVIEDRLGIVAFIPDWDFDLAVFRKNDSLSGVDTPWFLFAALKGDIHKNAKRQ